MRFLIADDDLACRDYFSHTLSALGECELAATGDECLELLEAAHRQGQHFDLLLLDARLPDISANELLRRSHEICRAHGCMRETKSLLLTSSWADTAQDEISIHDVNCAFERPQPIDENLLRHTVRGLLPAQRPTPTRTEATPHGASAAPPRPAGDLRFLIVDDDRLCREFLRDLLAPLGQCDVVVDGHEAIRAVRLAIDERAPYDLITLDIMMPQMDGHETLEALRAIEHQHGLEGLSGTKVIMTTALSDSKHCIRAFREGCEAYITKPLHEAELFAKMRDLNLLEPEVATS